MQCHGCRYIYLHTGQQFDFQLNLRQTNKRRPAINWINKKVEVAAICIVAMNRRSEDARIARVVLFDDAANVISI